MHILGIEGTAHTCGVGVVKSEPDDAARCRVLANEVAMLRPETGGIHPREAAEHHVAVLPGLVRAALERAGLAASDLDGIAFSQGPGLGPCLRTVATAARAIALRHDLPLLGVNHCVAHLEIARATTPAADPVMLYASGGNTQVIAEAAGRYRVFGETLDIGIGNALDKFAREVGIPFPGGPRIEQLAREGKRLMAEEGSELPVLPYSVKGMDVAFSGIVTAAHALLRDGIALPVVCHAIEEWCFAMLVEVTERAVAYTGKDTVVLGGGVGRNARLRAMLETMAQERGAAAHWPEPALLSDNGAMIAWCGLLMLKADHPTPIVASTVDQRQRTDEVPLVWRKPGTGLTLESAGGRMGAERFQGAEAVVTYATFLGRDVVIKRRTHKAYRHKAIEGRIMAQRTRREVDLLVRALESGVRVPHVLDAEPESGVIVMERIMGPTILERLAAAEPVEAARVMMKTGAEAARLHAAGIVHGDLTTANVLLSDASNEAVPIIIDFGLAGRSEEPEARAVDLHIMHESLQAAHPGDTTLWVSFRSGYEDGASGAASGILAQLADLEQRGRYKSMTV